MWEVHEKFMDGSYEHLPGKYQFGDLAHAKKRVRAHRGKPVYFVREDSGTIFVYDKGNDDMLYQLLKHRKNPVKNPSLNNQLWRALAGFVVMLRSANRDQIEDALLGAKQGMNDYAIAAEERAIYKKMATVLRSKLREFAPRKNPRKPQHWIVTVNDTTNNQKIASTYFDGTMTAAKKYFRKEKTIAAYWGKSGYVITMQPNAIILWDGYVSRNPRTKSQKTDLTIFNAEVKRFQTMSSSDLMQYWSAHQNGRGAAGIGLKSRSIMGDLANIAANLATAKNTKGDTKKMYEKIAHDIVKDAKRKLHGVKKNPETETRELSLYADNLGSSSQGIEKEVYEIRKKFGAAVQKKRPKKELMNLAKHAAHRAARAYSQVHGSGAAFWTEIFTDKDLNDTAKYLYDSFYEEYSYTGNPKHKKKARKKKYLIFGYGDGDIRYPVMRGTTLGFTLTKGETRKYGTRESAIREAKHIYETYDVKHKLGVADSRATVTQLLKESGGKA